MEAVKITAIFTSDAEEVENEIDLNLDSILYIKVKRKISGDTEIVTGTIYLRNSDITLRVDDENLQIIESKIIQS